MKQSILWTLLILALLIGMSALFPSEEYYPDSFTTLTRTWLSTSVIIDDPDGCQANEIFRFPQSLESVEFFVEKLCDERSDALGEFPVEDHILYSNIADNATAQYVRDVLVRYNIPTDAIDNFFYYVDYYNDAVESQGLVESGFVTLPDDDPYRLYDYLTQLEEHDYTFMGTNCRITTFTLLKDRISVGSGEEVLGPALPFDEHAIGGFPRDIFSDEELRQYRILFHPISTPRVTDQSVHIQHVQDYRAEHDVVFPDQPGMSVISLFTHTEIHDVVFIGHMGLLLEDDDFYIFLEKLSFDLPYQAVIFQSKQQLHDYLMDKYARYTSPETADPFIMENDQPFLGE